MGATAILAAGLRIWTRNWFPWFVVTIVMTGVISVIIAAVDPWTGTYGIRYWFGDPSFIPPDPTPLAVVLSLGLAFVAGPWEIVVLTRSALRATLGEPASGRALIGRTIRGVHSILWIFVLLAIALIPVAILLFAIASAAGTDEGRAIFAFIPLALLLFALPRLATLTHVFVGEDARGTRAIAGAWRLSRSAWGVSLGTILLILLIATVISIVPSLIIGQAFASPVVGDAIPRAIVQALLNGVLTPMGTAVLTALYLELHARKGTLDQRALRTNLARFD